ncbi:hypothetical protein DPEC_G00078740 [Dallia pectoralis]|uniref:Uncharacterized protein n=1 Tax=Dallia pectoralis TaxID=75939 RepID=A0ACC2H454_DALPE|nr:hypothetical protein DPEC_G00078740 [Dallia pectoralis]
MSAFLFRPVSLAFLIIMSMVLMSVSVKLSHPSKVTITCCTKVTDIRIDSPLEGYRIQAPWYRCVNAIVFYKKGGGMICTDPKATWASSAMKDLVMM